MARQEWIEVDAETIASASRCDSGQCMIAEALRKAKPEISGITVESRYIRFSDRAKGVRYLYLMPDIGYNMLQRFDNGEIVEPWKFKLPSRPTQVSPILSEKGKANRSGRPTSRGGAKITEQGKNYIPTIRGGKMPPLGAFAYSDSGGKTNRTFGAKIGLYAKMVMQAAFQNAVALEKSSGR
jgi:hypothetical protein